MGITSWLSRFNQNTIKEVISPHPYFLPRNDVLQNMSQDDLQTLYTRYFCTVGIGEMEEYNEIANGDTWVIPFLNILLAYANSLGYQDGWIPDAGNIEFCMYYGINANVKNVLNCAITAGEHGYFFNFTSSIDQNGKVQSSTSLNTIYYPTSQHAATLAMQQMGLIEEVCVEESVAN